MCAKRFFYFYFTVFVTCIFSCVAFSEEVTLRDDIESNEFGYVDSNLCSTCHVVQFEGFKNVGMYQSFRAASSDWLNNEKLKELPFFHSLSNRYYNLFSRGEKVYFQRYQLDDNNEKLNEIVIQIDYLLGSGNKTTSLLFRTDNDELFQLPINWYSETGSWEMAPGFETAQHYGISRRVQRECMFCHNAYPQNMSHDGFLDRDTFPENLKQGIDCQRCHGPGLNHLLAVKSPGANIKTIRDTIVNPGKLDNARRDSVCLQCHLLPSVSMMGTRRFNRSDYSFRPGEILSDYLIHVQVEELGRSVEERFEINHHGFRLQQSTCFSQSKGDLTCISCHNPHSKPSKLDFYEKIDTVCASCHTDVQNQHNIAGFKLNAKRCVSCHMPQKRAQDVPHVLMTDHKIGVYSDLSSLTREVVKDSPILTDLTLFDDGLSLTQLETDIYRLVTILLASPSYEYAAHLKSRLLNTHYSHVKPYIVLAETFIQTKHYDEALEVLNYIEKNFGTMTKVSELFAMLFVATDHGEKAEKAYQTLLKIDKGSAETYFNYGLLMYKREEFKEALKYFYRSAELRGNFALPLMYIGLSLEALEQHQEAIDAYIQSTSIDPLLERSYVRLIQLLHHMDNKVEALRYYKVALENLGETVALLSLSGDPDYYYIQKHQNIKRVIN